MKTVRLGDAVPAAGAIADGPFGSNLKTDDYSATGVRVIRLGNIGNGRFLDTDRAFVSVEHYERLVRHSAHPGDVLVAALGDGARPAGRACIVPPSVDRALLKADCFRVRCDGTDLDPEFLMNALNNPSVLEGVAEASRGATRPRMTLAMLKDTAIAVPDHATQRRTAMALARKLRLVAEMRKSASADKAVCVSMLRRFIDGVFERGWPVAPLGGLVHIQTGYAFESACFRPSGIRLLRNANVQHTRIDWCDVVRLDPALESDFDRFLLDVGDVVLSLDRPIVSGGLKVARIAEEDVPSLLLQRVARFQLGPLIDADYLYAFLRSSVVAEAVGGHEQSLGVPHVSPRQVAAIEMPTPPIAEQRRIAAELRERLATIDQMTRAIDAQLAAIEALPAALLRRAFEEIEAA